MGKIRRRRVTLMLMICIHGIPTRGYISLGIQHRFIYRMKASAYAPNYNLSIASVSFHLSIDANLYKSKYEAKHEFTLRLSFITYMKTTRVCKAFWWYWLCTKQQCFMMHWRVTRPFCVHLAYHHVCLATNINAIHRADSRLATGQWETSLQSNVVSHWLGANLESALHSCHTMWRVNLEI